MLTNRRLYLKIDYMIYFGKFVRVCIYVYIYFEVEEKYQNGSLNNKSYAYEHEIYINALI